MINLECIYIAAIHILHVDSPTAKYSSCVRATRWILICFKRLLLDIDCTILGTIKYKHSYILWTFTDWKKFSIIHSEKGTEKKKLWWKTTKKMANPNIDFKMCLHQTFSCLGLVFQVYFVVKIHSPYVDIRCLNITHSSDTENQNNELFVK